MLLKLRKVFGWGGLVLLTLLTFHFGSEATGEYIFRVYLSDFNFFGTLWLVFTIFLIFVVLHISRKLKIWQKITVYFLCLGPQLLLIIGTVWGYYYKDTSGFESQIKLDSGIIKLAPPGPGFPIVPTDFPGNHVIPWLGWKNWSNWDETNNTCSHLSEDGKKLLNIKQDVWRLPTAKEVSELISLFTEGNDKIWSSNFPIWWTATTDKYENCAVSKNGQCHIIFSLTGNAKVETGYVPLYQAYRCVRDLD